MERFAIAADGDGRLQATGDLTFTTAAAALNDGLRLLQRNGTWVVDLSAVTSGDSAGVAVLVEWIAAVRKAGGSIRYANVPAQMRAIARIADLEDLLLSR
ncbi:MAG: STAS domain-containing protein [Steroidobacteraceae bacterium]